MGLMLIVSEFFSFSLWWLWCYRREEIRMELKKILDEKMEKDYLFLCDKTGNTDPYGRMIKRILFSFISGLTVFAVKKKQLDLFTVLNAVMVFVVVYKADHVILKVNYTEKLSRAKKEFPYYLNHLAILIQNNPVPNAIEKSIKEAPEIFQKELRELALQIHSNGADQRPYLDFARKFPQVEDINRIMRTLFSLSITAANRERILTAFSRIANEKILGARRIECQTRVEKQNMIPYLLFLWLGFVILNMIASIKLF